MKRCFDIKMVKSWIMMEDERKALMQARADKKQRKQLAVSASNMTTKSIYDYTSERSNCESQIERVIDCFTCVEMKEIESIVTKYGHAYQYVPYRAELLQFCRERPEKQVIEVNTTDLFSLKIIRFRTMECIRTSLRFLLVTS